MKNILFVDDEINILNGLKRMLNAKKKEWHMVFVLSGENALSVLETQSFDIIVSDMRMPVMDGVKLLATVRDKYPQVTRIALSGYSDTQMILESVRSTHLFISKPTNFDILTSAIERSLSIQAMINDSALRNFISGINSLPSVPEIHNQLVKELASDDVSIESIGRIIEKDIGISVKLLQIVNSAFFGLARNVLSPMEAAAYLGTDIIKSLVLSIKIFEIFEDASHAQKSNNIFSQSQMVAKGAAIIAKAEGFSRKECDQLMSAGLLQDVGKLIMYSYFPTALHQQFEQHQGMNLTLETSLERQIFGVSHAQVGAYLLHLWGLPLSIVEYVAFHQGQIEPANFDELTLLDILYLANLIISDNYGQALPEQISNNENFKKYCVLLHDNKL
jgi:HD-like signal output (HDOD) protein